MKANNQKPITFTSIIFVITLAFISSLITPDAIFAQPKPNKKGYADVNGIKLYYEIYGKGEPLVLLHGGLGSIQMFEPNIELLSKGRQVIAVDLQGHGRTADIDRPFSVEAMSEDIAALLQFLKIPKADVMGYSLGAGVGLQIAVRHPELVNKLVLVSAIIRRSDFYPDILAQQAQVGPAAAEQMKQTPMYQSYAKLNPHPEDWPRLLQKIGDFMKQDYDFSDAVRQVKAPTLVVAGDADIFPPKYAVRMFELLGGGQKDGGWDGSGQVASKLAILPGVTHYNMAMAPALVPMAIAFLDAQGTASK
ncbi:MAG: alpha/beta fold hydrolase [Candidatus Kapaibacterium sp.]